MEKNEVKNLSLKKQGIGMVIALIIQYLLGMITNLFVQFPDTKNEGKLWLYAWSQTSLALHIVLGILLLLGSVILLIRAFVRKDGAWILASTLGFLTILGSGIAGAIFVTKQSDVYSLAMALGFIVAFLSYFWGIYKGK